MTTRIRLAEPGDAAAIAAIYRPFVEQEHFTFEEVPPGAAEIGKRMSSPIHPWLVLEENGELVGYASTAAMRSRAAYRWSVETGIYLAPHGQRRGLGGKLLAEHLGILERQGFVTAIAGIALPNDASVRLHEKIGFRLGGIERGVGFKLGRWVDVARWQRDLADRLPSPAEPRPFGSLLQSFDG